MEELIEARGTTEYKAIKIALADHHRVNRCFNLLGLIYLDWSSMELNDAEVGKKRKRAWAGVNLMCTSKQSGRGCGRAEGSNVDRVATAKVAASSTASSMATARPMATISLVPQPSVVGGALPGHKMPSISHLPILQVISD